MKMTKEDKLLHNIISFYENQILELNEVIPTIYRIRIKSPELSHYSLPGQFINVKISEENVPFWRRPFSIHRINPNEEWIEILFRVVGKGTKLLSQKKNAELLNFIGPLGNNFTFRKRKIDIALLIAGGLGIAPLFFLCESLRNENITTHLFYGTKTKDEFCCLQEFEKLAAKIYLSTEDGSLGHKGFITDLLQNKITEFADGTKIGFYACGPNPMLHKVNLLAEELNIPCQVSLETLMGCGIGACLGCGVTAQHQDKKYVYVCKEGPVFNSSEIQLGD